MPEAYIVDAVRESDFVIVQAGRWELGITRLADEQDHHPTVVHAYREVEVVTWSHDVDAITARDHRLAAAVDLLAAAIEAGEASSPPSDDLHLMYSNRSACYLKLGRAHASSALLDAEKCTTLRPEWAKGWGRKGMALSELHQHSIRARLGNRMMTATFAHEVTLTAFWHQIEHLLRHQRVVDQSVAASQQPMGLAGK